MKRIGAMLLAFACWAAFVPGLLALDHDGTAGNHDAPDAQPSDGEEPSDPDDAGGGFSAPDTEGTIGEVTSIERTAAVFVETRPPANPIVAATIADESGSAVIGEVDDSSAPSDDDCRERAPSEYNEEGDFYYTGRCIQSRI